ncbi:MAG TPA: phosphoglycerate mutase family protein [Candidatus Saccharimonadales bacterium]
MSKPFYLLRHGRYDSSTMGLSTEGISQDAPFARDSLIAKGLGRDTLLLSSDQLRCLQTAEIIADGLGGPTVVPSRRIAEGGNTAKGVKSLDEFIAKALVEADVELGDDQPLVVVTHGPMVAIAEGRYYDGAADATGYGVVMEYRQGSWANPGFQEGLEYVIDRKVEMASES